VHFFVLSVLTLVLASFGIYRLFWGVPNAPAITCRPDIACPDMSIHTPSGRSAAPASLHLYATWLASEPVFLGLTALVVICGTAAIVRARPRGHPPDRDADSAYTALRSGL
jgi:hypothetical protein